MKSQIIVDTGPLVAFLVRGETHHEWVVEKFRGLPAPFLTCEAVLTETFYLLRGVSGGAAKFFSLLDSGLLQTPFSLLQEKASLERLIARYGNVPMSVADACLVRLSELHSDCRVFTLDSDFRIYRRHVRQAIPLITP